MRANQQNSVLNSSSLPGPKPGMVTPSKPVMTSMAHSTPNNSSPSSGILNHSVGNFAAVAAANSHLAGSPATSNSSLNTSSNASSKTTCECMCPPFFSFIFHLLRWWRDCLLQSRSESVCVLSGMSQFRKVRGKKVKKKIGQQSQENFLF